MTKTELSGEVLKTWGHKPGKAFGDALVAGKAALACGETLDSVRAIL